MKKLITAVLLVILLLATKVGNAVAANTSPFVSLYPVRSEVPSCPRGTVMIAIHACFLNIETQACSQDMLSTCTPKEDTRVTKLRTYLEKHKSPLSEYADEFVLYADQYDLDWRLVPAISGVESTFGKRIPANSYNAYGWANGAYKFTSWENSIEHVSKTLKAKYVDRGLDTVPKIARTYAPPSNTWGGNVTWFMNEIESMPIPNEDGTLMSKVENTVVSNTVVLASSTK